MEYILIIVVALAASFLTFFSGFGLGTLLLPAFLPFFPVDLAIAMTAIVHFLNNIFKTGLIGRHGSRRVVLIFGIPALFAAIAGAWVLGELADFSIDVQFDLAGREFHTTVINIIIGILLLIFAVFEILPRGNAKKPGVAGLIGGGVLSGFFGGLSGHQGALRSAFLIRLGLSKETFVATGIIISLFIDISRLGVYWTNMPLSDLNNNMGILLAAVIAAFVGAVIGRRLLRKVTIRALQYFIGAGISVVGVLLILGIL